MASLTEFRSRVLPNIPDCPDMVADQAVLDACIEFCERSNIVRATLAQITLTIAQFQVTPAPPASQKIVQIKQVWIDGTEISPASEDSTGVFGFVTAVAGQTVTLGQPRIFSEISPGLLAMYPRPDKAYVCTVRAATKPSRSATAVDDVLLEDWAGAIAAGALSILFDMSAPWADPAKAKRERAKFDSAIGNALIEATRGRNRAEDRVTPVWI